MFEFLTARREWSLFCSSYNLYRLKTFHSITVFFRKSITNRKCYWTNPWIFWFCWQCFKVTISRVWINTFEAVSLVPLPMSVAWASNYVEFILTFRTHHSMTTNRITFPIKRRGKTVKQSISERRVSISLPLIIFASGMPARLGEALQTFLNGQNTFETF